MHGGELEKRFRVLGKICLYCNIFCIKETEKRKKKCVHFDKELSLFDSASNAPQTGKYFELLSMLFITLQNLRIRSDS